MAKKAQTRSKKPAGKLAGQKVAFVGKFGYANMWLADLRSWVRRLGASEVAPTKLPDYLIAGDGRGGKPPGDVARIQKQHPSVIVLDMAGFARLATPSPDELLFEIAKGRHDHRFWDSLEQMYRLAGQSIDLSNANLGKADLSGAQLRGVNLDGVDLRHANLEYAHLPKVRGAKFDGAKMANVYLFGAEDCSFRDADMTEAWFYDVHQWNRVCRYASCDFSGAKITKAAGRKTDAAGCIFRGADLSEGEFEESNFNSADLTDANLTQVHLPKSKLSGAKLSNANLFRSDLRDTTLIKADLRNSNLRQAILSGADLASAEIAGADFADANLLGANIAKLDMSKAKNFQTPAKRTAGPRMRELAKVAASSREFNTRIEMDIGDGEIVELHASSRKAHGNRVVPEAMSSHKKRDDKYGENERLDGRTFEQGMLNLAMRWSFGKLRLDTVTAKGSKCPMRGEDLRKLALAAWCEAFGVDAAEMETKSKTDAAKRQSLEADMLAELKDGPAGIKKWNARPKHERLKIAKLRPLDLSGCDLSGADFEDCDLSGANLEGANLKKAIMQYGSWDNTNFAGADLRQATLASGETRGASFENAMLSGIALRGLTMRNASFRGADLTGVNMEFVDLRGCDLSTAILKGTTFEDVDFDEKTHFPKGFAPPETMTWKGPGPHPALAKKTPRAKKAGAMTFDGFLKALANKVINSKLQKATSMLKAERFQLFSEVKDDSLIGIVKSQTDKDLVYSCRLCSDGSFGCCTQNLKPCGGLQGSLCKHLLVLIVGLTKAGQLDPATVDNWVNSSRSQKPAIDKDVMSETFIRYKGAEAGEIDWRPTETIPEDFYSM